jgi:hypothetical protein
MLPVENVKTNDNKNGGIRFDENEACESCGRFGAYAFDGEYLCPECYQQRGSCCASEFGQGVSRFLPAREDAAPALRSDRRCSG